MQKIVLASSNQGKLEELQTLLSSYNINVVPQSELSVPDADETGLTFVENAIIKARQACSLTDLPAIADDSGLEVDALQGAPGIYSARYAGDNKDFKANIDKVLKELEGLPEEQRTARFRCCLVYMRHASDPSPIICQGYWEGIILEKPQGEGGFGYDPIFYVPTHDCAASELDAKTKNQLSHRGLALSQFIEQFNHSESHVPFGFIPK